MTSALDLTRPRSLPALLALTARTWIRHLPVFVVMSAVVVVPVRLLADALLDGDEPWPFTLVRELAEAFVVPALVIAAHVAAVQDLRAGRRPSVPRSLAVAARHLPTASTVLVLTTLLSALALIPLVLPSIYVLVRWYLVVGVAVVDDVGPRTAMERSWTLARGGRWWRIFALVVLDVALESLLLDATDVTGPAFLAGAALLLSFVSLAGTLLLFDLRARDA